MYDDTNLMWIYFLKDAMKCNQIMFQMYNYANNHRKKLLIFLTTEIIKIIIKDL